MVTNHGDPTKSPIESVCGTPSRWPKSWLINGGLLIFPTSWDYPSGGLPAELCWTRPRPITHIWLCHGVFVTLPRDQKAPKTSMAPTKKPSQNERIVFQPIKILVSTVSLREGRYSTQNHLVGGCTTNAWTMNIFGDPVPKFPGANTKIFFIKVVGPAWGDGLYTPLVSFTYTLRMHGTTVYLPTWTVWTPKPRTHALKIMGVITTETFWWWVPMVDINC